MPDTNAHGDAVAQAQPGPGAASGTPPVSAEARTDERRLDGLKPGERVIVSGYEAFLKMDRVDFTDGHSGEQ